MGISRSSTGGSSYTSENARDDIATALVAGANVTITPNDGADTITIAAATTGASGIPASTVNAKGDLIAGTADDTIARLGVGTDGQVLTAASGQTTGLSWTTPAISAVTGLQTALDGKPDSSDIDTITVLTQATYDGITPDSRTFYIISS